MHTIFVLFSMKKNTFYSHKTTNRIGKQHLTEFQDNPLKMIDFFKTCNCIFVFLYFTMVFFFFLRNNTRLFFIHKAFLVCNANTRVRITIIRRILFLYYRIYCQRCIVYRSYYYYYFFLVYETNSIKYSRFP